jgi:protein ImuB
MAVWCPDWSITAAGLAPSVPAVVVHANRVVAISAAARDEGVVAGIRRREAQARCPELVVLAHDLDRDARAFEPVPASIDPLCPRVEVERPGWCLLATRGPSRYFGGDEKLAERVRTAVLEANPNVPNVRIGVADGVFAARLAAGADRIVERNKSQEFVAPFPVTVLERPELASILQRLGLHRLGDFAGLEPAKVLARFGVDGQAAHRLARGQDERPIDATIPPPDFSVEAEVDPPADRVDRAAFVAKTLADQLHDDLATRGLACTRILVEAETEHGEHYARLWRHDGALTSVAIAERVRWQLDGWLNAPTWAERPTSGIVLVRLTPDEVRPDTGRQLGFWGGTTLLDERAGRALARVQGMLGRSEAVVTAVVHGGRSPAEQATFVPWGDGRERITVNPPWPGAIPSPSPAIVHAPPLPAQVTDAGGDGVLVTGRGGGTGEPGKLSIDGGPWVELAGWAGPWPVDERWWDPAARRRRARFQLLTADGRAHLAAVEGKRWWIEATYD